MFDGGYYFVNIKGILSIILAKIRKNNKEKYNWRKIVFQSLALFPFRTCCAQDISVCYKR